MAEWLLAMQASGERTSGRPSDFLKRVEHPAAVRPERPVGASAGRHDSHAWPCDLGHELGQALRNRGAMGHQHEPDEPVAGLSLHSTWDSTMSNVIRQ